MAHQDKRDDVTRFDLPFGAEPPRLTNPELGIARIVARGDSHSYAIDVTVLDAPDHRLIRAGVLLAHRVTGGEGEWYLAAPEWAPTLPAEKVVPFGDGDVPDEFAALIRPFRRTAALGPVASCEARRVEYGLRAEDGTALATLRDEHVTVRRSGLTTARYREVTLTPTEALSPEQRSWLEEAIMQVGGAQTREFPSFVSRLGAPATGLSDLPSVREWSRDDTLEAFVSALMSHHLHRIFAADLDVRSGAAADTSLVRRRLDRLQRDLRGLYPVLDAAWRRELDADLTAVLAEDTDASLEAQLGERYLTVLDKLVAAVRGPRLGTVARRRAGKVLGQELDAALTTLRARFDTLQVESPDEAWDGALASAENVAALARVSRHLWGRSAGSLAKRAERLVAALRECTAIRTTVSDEELAARTPREAFEHGRAFERATLVQAVEREDVLESWPRESKRMRAPEA